MVVLKKFLMFVMIFSLKFGCRIKENVETFCR